MLLVLPKELLGEIASNLSTFCDLVAFSLTSKAGLAVCSDVLPHTETSNCIILYLILSVGLNVLLGVLELGAHLFLCSSSSLVCSGRSYAAQR